MWGCTSASCPRLVEPDWGDPRILALPTVPHETLGQVMVSKAVPVTGDLSEAPSPEQDPAATGTPRHGASYERPATRTGRRYERPATRTGRRPALLIGLLVAALVVLPAVAAAAWSTTQPPTHAVEIDLLHEASNATAADSIDRQLSTQQVLLLRRPFLDGIAQTVQRDPDELAESIDIEIVQDSSVLRVRVRDEDQERAWQTAAVMADRHVGIADRLAASSNIGRVHIVSAPTVLVDPVAPQPTRAAAGGALVGLVLATGLLVVLRVRRQRGSVTADKPAATTRARTTSGSDVPS